MRRLGIAVLVLAAAVALWFLRPRDDAAPRVPDPDLPAQADGNSTADPRRAVVAPGANANDGEPAPRRPVDPSPPGEELPQGVRGRVVDATGTPLPGAAVLLVEHLARNPFESLIQADRGVVVPPLARTTTGADGRFALGVQALSPNDYEVRALAPGFAETTLPRVTLFAARWTDLGDVALERGLRLSGKVTVQGSDGFPVPGATVVALPVGLGPQTTPTPEREAGIVAIGDTTGRYLLEGLRPGFVQVSAVAPGFARVLRPVVELRAGVENTCDFELPRGSSIVGSIVAADGRGIGGASIEARSISTQLGGVGTARSDADGRFEMIGLVEGAYVLTATAHGYVRGELKPVRAGEQDARIVLGAQSSLSVRVTDQDGKSPPRFDLLLLGWNEPTGSLADVPRAQIARVFAAQLVDGAYRAGTVDPGSYVVQVEAPGFAKSFSEPFTVNAGEREREVGVVLRAGGSIKIRVARADGSPLAGASVATLPGFADENPLTKMLGQAMPVRTTRATATTGGDGFAELGHLAAGTYQIGVMHADHCESRLRDVVVAEGTSVVLPELRLVRGSTVTGTATVDGVPAGQIKVSLHSDTPQSDDGPAMVFAEAVTDESGRFTVAQRLPPGRYIARAARQSLPTILLQVVDYQKTRQELTISPGQDEVLLHFPISSH